MLYQQILRLHPNNFVARHLFGVLRGQQGRNSEALELIGGALKLKHDFPEAWSNYGNILRDLGRVLDALESYNNALGFVPAFAEALNNRSTVLCQLGRYEEAIESCDLALKARARYAEAHYNRGNALRGLNRFDAALESYAAALAITPTLAEALNSQAGILRQLGRLREALACCERALAIRSNFSDALFNRGNILRDLRRLPEAIANYESALRSKPALVEAVSNRAVALMELGRDEEALAGFDHALEINHRDAHAYYNRGRALANLGHFEEALDSYDMALALVPDHADAFSNRGVVLGHLGRYAEALASCDKALALKPGVAVTLGNRGNILQDLLRPMEALESYDQAILVQPCYAEAHWYKSLCLLRMGRIDEGLELYEWRKKRPEPVGLVATNSPEWLGGEDIRAKRLLVYAEQGLGDTIQFCRYIALAQQQGAAVTFSVPTVLMRLMRGLVAEVKMWSLELAPPDCDCHIALLSMPLAFKSSNDQFPAVVPYLRAESERIALWRERIGPTGFKVGICWRGRTSVEASRFFPLREFENLSKITGVRLISLQKDGKEDVALLRSRFAVEISGDDFDEGPDAFIDSAAVIANLDLVITADTAIAHLAGALAKPTWLALKFMPDWRWFLNRGDSPWYPTMRLFRQEIPGCWKNVFSEMEIELPKLLDQRSGD